MTGQLSPLWSALARILADAEARLAEAKTPVEPEGLAQLERETTEVQR
ncbi:MAG TPA: hypothetical protein VFA26_18555 [Gemmataceae bacterium]|nr:hypothetical protein [Gemmataceae bacterium]